MPDAVSVTDEQARWLRALLESRPKKNAAGPVRMPDEVHRALFEKGLIQWKRGAMEITLEGIRLVARRPPLTD
jgi:hypothetical protein